MPDEAREWLENNEGALYTAGGEVHLRRLLEKNETLRKHIRDSCYKHGGGDDACCCEWLESLDA